MKYIKYIKNGSLIILFNLYYLSYLYEKKSFTSAFLCSKKSLVDEIRNFKSYSQVFEDLILFCAFYEIENGFYIDIGANDPNDLSVTKAFYLRGWNGINIEPLPDKYDLLIKERPRDINLKIGVGKSKGNSTLYIYGTGSTMKRQYAFDLNKKININIDTLSNIYEQYNINKFEIQFCKIDVEGGEENVLLGNNWHKCRPKIFVIESTAPATTRPTYSSWEYILLNNDYSFVYQYSINRYYIDNNHPELKNRFINLDNYIELYKKEKSKKIKN